MASTIEIARRLKRAKLDTDLARILRSGVEGLRVPDFKVSELRLWTSGSYRKRLYQAFEVQKRRGGTRTILAPHFRLKTTQRILSKALAQLYSPPAAAHAYIAGKGIKSNAGRHIAQSSILQIDIQDFFPSIHFGRVRGLLLKSPFELDEVVADLVSLLCTYPLHRWQSVLPQGAPSSPILSNLICRGLDREFTILAKSARCQYSRYADDITFSSRGKGFPPSWTGTEDGKVTAGPAVEKIVLKHGFLLNAEKTRLIDSRSSLRVTGLVVNKKLNVPRSFIRALRSAIYCANEHGIPEAAERFHRNYDTKYRPDGMPEPDFLAVIRGRLSHVANIRGWNNVVVLRLAHQLSNVDPNYRFNPSDYVGSLPTVTLAVEGSTDWVHLQAALKWFKSREEFSNLDLTVDPTVRPNGDQPLIRRLRRVGISGLATPTIFLFDSDKSAIVKEVTVSGSPRKWGTNVFSWALPTPAHRNGPVCIELYFRDGDLLAEDEHGRRIFLRSEFDEAGDHRSLPLSLRHPNASSLIVDNNVLHQSDGKNVAMTKANFANRVSLGLAPFSTVDFSAFSGVLSVLQDLISREFHADKEIASWLKSIGAA